MLSEGLYNAVTRAHGRPRVLFLDYDGTLVPFADRPERAAPDPELLEVLDRLSRRFDTSVHIVSGRGRPSLETWFGHLPVALHAEHGFWRRRHHRGAWVAPLVRDHAVWMKPVVDVMETATRHARDSFIERKTACLAWHYRLSDPAEAASARLRMRRELGPLCDEHHLGIVDGNCVLEVRVRGVHKGEVVKEMLRDADPAAFVLAVGDDVTDEDMFAALPTGAIAVCAGLGASCAPFRVSGHTAVRRLLADLSATPEQEWVLVVDDNAGIRRAVLDLLVDAGISAFAVADGAQALEVLREGGRRPSVVVTDLTMPNLDGRGLIARMRREGELARIPVVMMTAMPFTLGLPKDIPVVNKPFKTEYLLSVIRERMRRPA